MICDCGASQHKLKYPNLSWKCGINCDGNKVLLQVQEENSSVPYCQQIRLVLTPDEIFVLCAELLSVGKRALDRQIQMSEKE